MADIESITRFDLMQVVNELDVEAKTNTTVIGIRPNSIITVDKYGKRKKERVEKIVLAVGQISVGMELKKSIEDKGISVKLAGDVKDVGKIIDIVTGGFQAGR